MFRVENLIVKRKSFISEKIELKTILFLIWKIQLQSLCIKKYEPEDLKTLFFKIDFLGLTTEEKIRREKYFNSLRITRDYLPFKVSFYIVLGKFGDNEGLIINIRSEPAILYKIRQMGLRPI
jgi:hypothetical protein